MTKKRKTTVAIAATVILLAAAAISLYIKFSQAFAEPVEEIDGDYRIIGGDEAITTESPASAFGLGAVENTDESADVETTYAPADIDIDIDTIRMPFDEQQSDADGLLGDVRNRKLTALTVMFDGVEIKPGIAVRDIIDKSYWYTIRENDMLSPGDATFLTLDNDFWNDKEVNLTEKKTIRNGDIVLWVHNYGSEPAAIRDCTIYKYQISYLGCWDWFSERPVLKYRDIYSLGSTEFPDTPDSIMPVTLDAGKCTRYIYGAASGCEVILDANEHGLVAITAAFNEYYGPDFDKSEVT